MTDFDAVVVGASLAGCATAIHLGRAGHRVALVDKRPDPAAYKRVCGHFIQSSAVPALERLGVLDELEAAGAVRGHGRVWSPYGWFGDPAGPGRNASLSLRREKLDPLLRRRAAETPGVELLLGHAITGTERTPAGRRVELSRGPDEQPGGERGAAAPARPRWPASAPGRAPTPGSPTGGTSTDRRSAPARACTSGSAAATSGSPRRPTAV